ncbi:hypothetical protein [Halarchaeum sp. P4]|uniref:hypothetical protein n=1 Tax=Halarchaeum sp. P4 TaxID=3421639 RepID=UPI003EB98D2C
MTMKPTGQTAVSTHEWRAVLTRRRRLTLALGALLVVASEPALAQSVGTAFCESDLAATVTNVFTLIQFGGPLLGGVIALGATVARPMARRADKKLELTEMRNQALIWGVIVAPLGTVILRFLLNNVVVGGTSCGF